MCVCICIQQAPERMGQSDAVYEVVSLQREAERSNESRGRLASPTEEEEADEGMDSFLLCFPQFFSNLLLLISLVHNYQYAKLF